MVRQAPFDVDPGDIEATLTEIAQKLLTTGTADPGAARDELLHTMACKAAIKGGWKTSPRELERGGPGSYVGPSQVLSPRPSGGH